MRALKPRRIHHLQQSFLTAVFFVFRVINRTDTNVEVGKTKVVIAVYFIFLLYLYYQLKTYTTMAKEWEEYTDEEL